MAYFRTGTNDFSSIQYTNLTAGNIKNGVTVTVKDPNDITLKSVTGNYITPVTPSRVGSSYYGSYSYHTFSFSISKGTYLACCAETKFEEASWTGWSVSGTGISGTTTLSTVDTPYDYTYPMRNTVIKFNASQATTVNISVSGGVRSYQSINLIKLQ